MSTSIPFVLGATALLSGKIDGAWIRHARSWALLSFLILATVVYFFVVMPVNKLMDRYRSDEPVIRFDTSPIKLPSPLQYRRNALR